MKAEFTMGASAERAEYVDGSFEGAWCRVHALYNTGGHEVQTSYFYEEFQPNHVVLQEGPTQYCTIDGIQLSGAFDVAESGQFIVRNNHRNRVPEEYLRIAAAILTAAHRTFDAEARARKMALEKMEIPEIHAIS